MNPWLRDILLLTLLIKHADVVRKEKYGTPYSWRIIAYIRVSVCTRRAYPLRLYPTFCPFISSCFSLFLIYLLPSFLLQFLSSFGCDRNVPVNDEMQERRRRFVRESIRHLGCVSQRKRDFTYATTFTKA